MSRPDLTGPSPGLRAAVAAFLAEDVGRGDRTSEAVVPPGMQAQARIEARQDLVVAGIEAARACFEACSPGIDFSARVADGDRAAARRVLAVVRGELRAILAAERTALNLLGRLSGVATLTARYVAAVAGTGTRIVDTRKTTPGLRALEKAAVRAGGGGNHRHGLDDGILIKDNHVTAAGGVAAAVAAARRSAPHGLRVEVEVSDLGELQQAVDAGADAILLDNMDVEEVAEAVRLAPRGVLLEASGGITLDNVAAYAATGVDLVSVGALTHSAPAADVSLEVDRTWC